MTTNNPVHKKKCVIYCRVFSAKQTSDGAGLQGQELSCRDYANAQEYEVLDVFNDVISGRYAVRPGMDALLDFLKGVEGQDYVVIVYDINRFARDVAAHTELRNKIIDLGARIESPNSKFGDDSGSRLIEHIFAAVAAHDREKNAEQSKDRTLMRLHAGYWVFSAPPGYRYAKAPGGGKLLVRDEPVASYATEALEGFASGRFQTQSEVKRFLDSKPEYPKGYNRTDVKFDRIRELLTRVLYAGFLEYPKWSIPLTQAQHEPLISYETFLTIQRRLKEKAIAPARPDIDDDFPLRGFLICEGCGARVTANWSTSHTGIRYPYYLCQRHGCPVKGKSTPRDRVESQFEQILQGVVPDHRTLELAGRMFRDAWDKRAKTANEEAQRLRARATQVEREIEQTLNRLVRTKYEEAVAAYEKRISELQSEKALLDEQATKIGCPERSFDEMFELSKRFLANPYEIWKKGSTAVKRTVLRLVFAQPLGYDLKTGVRTAETTFPFKVLRFISGMDGNLVRAIGIEPTTFSLEGT